MKSHTMKACFERWKELSVDLKRREPHSPFTLNIPLFRASMCKEVVRELKLEWIGQMLEPPLLLTLGLEEAISKEIDKGEWKKIKEAIGYVSKGDPTRIFSYDAREEVDKHSQGAAFS